MANPLQIKPKLPCERTPYGFKWGATSVSRFCEQEGHIVIGIETPRQRVSIRVTPTGLIRIDEPISNAKEALNVTI